MKTIVAGKGVQGAYKQAALTYYGREDATSMDGRGNTGSLPS